MSEFTLPTEIVELPSKGLLYSEESGLKSGKIEMKYMTAKEEDILTNQSYISKGTVLDKLMQSLIVSEIDYNELLVGDSDDFLYSDNGFLYYQSLSPHLWHIIIYFQYFSCL